MIVIDFLLNIAREYYDLGNIHYVFITAGCVYVIGISCFAFMEGMRKEKSSAEDFTGVMVVGLLASVIFAFLAGIIPLIISTVGVLYLLFLIMFKWGKNYKKLQSYKKDETSEYLKEIARLEELVKQFEKSK